MYIKVLSSYLLKLYKFRFSLLFLEIIFKLKTKLITNKIITLVPYSLKKKLLKVEKLTYSLRHILVNLNKTNKENLIIMQPKFTKLS